MAFFNKLGDIARSVSDKTGDMLEISKLNAQIRASEDDIEELKLKLGEYFWSKYDSGVIMDETATSICNAIKGAYNDIAAQQAEISEIKSYQAAAKQQAAMEADARAQMKAHSRELMNEVQFMADSASAPAGSVCPFCGTPINDFSLFCGTCGTKLR